MAMRKDVPNSLHCRRNEVPYLQEKGNAVYHINSHERVCNGVVAPQTQDHRINNSVSLKHCCALLFALVGLLVVLQPDNNYSSPNPLLLDKLLSSPLECISLLPSLEDIMSLNLKRYFLGSPMALSTMMEIRCAPVCYSTERVYNLSDLQPGDHIRHVGSIYAHHSLVDRVLNKSAVLVVHFNDDRSNARKVSGCFPYFDKAIVLEQTLLLNTTVDVVELVVYDSEHQIEPKKERLRAARSRLGSTDYGLLTNNCEAFMHELCVGVRYSRQAEFINDLMHMLIFIPYLVLFHLCHERFGEIRTKSDTAVVSEMDEGPIIDSLRPVSSSSSDVANDKNSCVDHRSHLYNLCVNYVCISVLLLILYMWYRSCVLILTKFGKFFYRICFPDYY